MKTSTAAALAAGVAVLGLIGWRVYQKAAGQPAGGVRAKGGAATAVLAQPVRRAQVVDEREFTGTLYPREQFLVAPKVAGRLERLAVNIGETVTNGALIAALDSQEYTQQVAQAQAELEVARANVTDTASTLDVAAQEQTRVRELRKQKVASEAELDQAEARYRTALAKHEVALAQVKQREAALKADQVRLAYTRIAASWEGGGGTRVVGERFVDEGAMLRANDPIVSVLDVDTMVARIFAIERDYPILQTGQTARVSTDAFPGRTFEGTVVRKAPLLKESSRQARLDLEVPNPERLLAPGMFVRVAIRFAVRENAVVVPVSALVRRQDRRGVFRVDEAARTARFVPVTVGLVQGDRAEILEPGLDGRVVTLGQHLLEDGAALLLPDASAPADAGRQPGAPP